MDAYVYFILEKVTVAYAKCSDVIYVNVLMYVCTATARTKLCMHQFIPLIGQRLCIHVDDTLTILILCKDTNINQVMRLIGIHNGQQHPQQLIMIIAMIVINKKTNEPATAFM